MLFVHSIAQLDSVAGKGTVVAQEATGHGGLGLKLSHPFNMEIAVSLSIYTGLDSPRARTALGTHVHRMTTTDNDPARHFSRYRTTYIKTIPPRIAIE